MSQQKQPRAIHRKSLDQLKINDRIKNVRQQKSLNANKN